MYYLVSAFVLAVATALTALHASSLPADKRTIYYVIVPIMALFALAGLKFYISDRRKGRKRRKH